MHQTGKSNRPRTTASADEFFVSNAPPSLRYADSHSQTLDWKRQLSVYEAPSIVRTKLGGLYMRPATVSGARKYRNIAVEHVEKYEEDHFVQPEWSNDQPSLGVPEWAPDEEKRAKPIFVVTDDIFE